MYGEFNINSSMDETQTQREFFTRHFNYRLLCVGIYIPESIFYFIIIN